MVVIYTFRNDPGQPTERTLRYYVCDTLAERPSLGLLEGELAYTKDNSKIYRATSATTWSEVGGGAGGGATTLGELDDVDDAVAATNGHFLVADGTDYSNRLLLESDIPAAIARDTEVATAVSDHVALADPHTQYQKESEKGAASGYASLNGSTKVVEDPANATATATASKIPIADGSGKLDTWVSDASTTVKGKVELATDGESAANLAVQANDARLSNSRAPSGSATGDLTGSYPNPTIAPDAVTFAKMQNVSAASKLLGRGASGAGDVEEITLGTNLSMSGTTLNANGGGGGGTWTTIMCTADESKNNLATVANDATLVVTLTANTNYSIRLKALWLTNATVDLKYRLVFGGTTTRVHRFVRRTATVDTAMTIERKTAFDAADVVLTTTGTLPWLEEDILLQVGASGGTLALQWAQGTSGAGPTTRLEGSWMEYATT